MESKRTVGPLERSNRMLARVVYSPIKSPLYTCGEEEVDLFFLCKIFTKVLGFKKIVRCEMLVYR